MVIRIHITLASSIVIGFICLANTSLCNAAFTSHFPLASSYISENGTIVFHTLGAMGGTYTTPGGAKIEASSTVEAIGDPTSARAAAGASISVSNPASGGRYLASASASVESGYSLSPGEVASPSIFWTAIITGKAIVPPGGYVSLTTHTSGWIFNYQYGFNAMVYTTFEEEGKHPFSIPVVLTPYAGPRTFASPWSTPPSLPPGTVITSGFSTEVRAMSTVEVKFGANSESEGGVSGVTLSLSQSTDLLSADFNQDGTIDGDDLQKWNLDFGNTDQSDANDDGSSDGDDFLIWQRQHGQRIGAPAPTLVIPECSPIRLFASAALTLGARSRRLRRPQG